MTVAEATDADEATGQTEPTAVTEPTELTERAGIHAVARLARQLDRALDTTDVTLPQFRVMALIDNGSSASSALARRLAVSPPTVTAVVDSLVARRLVERRNDPGDRRRLALHLTAKGRRALREADAAIADRLRLISSHLDEPDAAADALASLAVWNDALDRFREEKHRGKAQ